MKHSDEETKRGAIARGQKDQYPQYDFDKFTLLKQTSSVCRMDKIMWNWPNEQKERLSIFFFFFFFFFSFQYLPPSWLGRVTRRQLFNSRTTRHIDCHKNIRNAGNCRHTLREWSLVTGIVLFHISVYQLLSPQKGNSKTDFTSIEFSI